MKRIAAPMVGGLVTSAFLTLEIIPVVYTYWRQEQVLWERLAPLDPRRLRELQILAVVQKVGWSVLALAAAGRFYADDLPRWAVGLVAGGRGHPDRSRRIPRAPPGGEAARLARGARRAEAPAREDGLSFAPPAARRRPHEGAPPSAVEHCDRKLSNLPLREKVAAPPQHGARR